MDTNSPSLCDRTTKAYTPMSLQHTLKEIYTMFTQSQEEFVYGNHHHPKETSPDQRAYVHIKCRGKEVVGAITEIEGFFSSLVSFNLRETEGVFGFFKKPDYVLRETDGLLHYDRDNLPCFVSQLFTPREFYEQMLKSPLRDREFKIHTILYTLDTFVKTHAKSLNVREYCPVSNVSIAPLA